MDYAAHYNRLIARARHRILTVYRERHHVVPRCIGGSNDRENIVALTPEEHFVAHQLLVKMHPGNFALVWSASCMTGATSRMQRSNKLYGWLRRRFAQMVSERHTGCARSAEARAKMSAAHLGKKRAPHTAETRAKMSAASKGRPKSLAHRDAFVKARTGLKLKPHSLEGRANQSRGVRAAFANGANHGNHSDPGYRARQSESMKRIWAERQLRKAG